MRKIFFASLLVLASVVASAQVKVSPLSEASSKNVKGPSFVYMLPTTSFKVTVTEIIVTDYKGYFSDYSESLLGLTNIIRENKTHYEIGAVELEPVTTPDVLNAFVVSCKNPASLDPLFTKEGYGVTDQCSRVYVSQKAELPDFFKNYADISYTQQQEAFVDTKIIDGVVTQVPANHTKTVSKSFEQKARQAADAIMKSRNDQYMLVAGEQETPYSGDAIAKMLSELKAWENNYMSLFTGVTLRDTVKYVLYITPQTGADDIEMFSFTETKGLVDGQVKTDAYTLKLAPLYNAKRISEAVEDLKSSTDLSSELRYKKATPVRVQMYINGRAAYDFGVVDMYQFSDIMSTPTAVKPHGVETFGFVY